MIILSNSTRWLQLNNHSRSQESQQDKAKCHDQLFTKFQDNFRTFFDHKQHSKHILFVFDKNHSWTSILNNAVIIQQDYRIRIILYGKEVVIMYYIYPDVVKDPVSRSMAVNKSDTNVLSDFFMTSNRFWLKVSRFFSRNPYTLYVTCQQHAQKLCRFLSFSCQMCKNSDVWYWILCGCIISFSNVHWKIK